MENYQTYETEFRKTTKGKPKVSVVIPSYNHERYVGEAVESVLKQTENDIEVIVIDDGSQDQSVEVIRRILAANEDRNLVLIERPNRGICCTLNEAVGLASGEYFAYLGSDDIWHPTKLEIQIAELERTGFAAAYSDCFAIDAEGDVMSRYGEQYPYHGGSIYHDLVSAKFQPASPTNLFRRDVIKNAGGFNESHEWEDRDLWIRISKDRSVAYLPQPLASYRVHGLNFSAVNLDKGYNYAIQCLDAAVERDPELAASRDGLRADIDANQAVAYYEKLQLAEARRFAVKALRKKPTNLLAWRTLVFSILGKRIVAKVRKSRREKIASRAVIDARQTKSQ